MGSIEPWMRLKVKADTFFLPDVDGTVYFRNNYKSFTLEGPSVESWIEKLLPVWNGQYTLESLTDGLPEPYRDRIFEIAEILYDNGFLRDVSQDEPHHLSEAVIEYFQSQIEIVDNLVGSGAASFETYRSSNILVVGHGSLLLSAVRALYESGAKTVHVCSLAADDMDVAELQSCTDGIPDAESPAVHFADFFADLAPLRPLIHDMDVVLYVSQSGDLATLRSIEAICLSEGALFVPAICIGNMGILTLFEQMKSTVGTEVRGGSDNSNFDALWRRLHQQSLECDLQICGFTNTAGSVLTNVAAFEIFKILTGMDTVLQNRVYTLQLETLQGSWNDVIPCVAPAKHTGLMRCVSLPDVLSRPKQTSSKHELLSFFTRITNSTCGIFHVWDEGNLSQLPLAQCRVQPVDGLSSGPAELLPETVSTGVTHEDARIESGLSGIEAYVERLCDGQGRDGESWLVGAGFTMAEAVGRALRKLLTVRYDAFLRGEKPDIAFHLPGDVEDERSRYYLDALRAAGEYPVIGTSRDEFGFPVAWAMSQDGNRFWAVGFHPMMAVRTALELTLLHVLASDIPFDVPLGDGFNEEEILTASKTIEQSGWHIKACDFAVEPFLTEALAGVVGVSLRKGAPT